MVTLLFLNLNTSNSFPNHNKDNKIWAYCVAPFGKALRFNKALKVLNLSGIHLHLWLRHWILWTSFFCDNKIGSKWVKRIAKGIKFNTLLEKTWFKRCKMACLKNSVPSFWTDSNITVNIHKILLDILYAFVQLDHYLQLQLLVVNSRLCSIKVFYLSYSFNNYLRIAALFRIKLF